MPEVIRPAKGWEKLTSGQKIKVASIWANNWSDVSVEIEKNMSPMLTPRGKNYDYIKIEFKIDGRPVRARISSQPNTKRIEDI